MRRKLLKQKNALKQRRAKRTRAKLFGTEEMPRVALFKSNRYLYAQAIDDGKGVTLASVDGKKLEQKANKESAKVIAKAMADALKKANIQKIIFDRRGNKYHGVVSEFADGLRENGITV